MTNKYSRSHIANGPIREDHPAAVRLLRRAGQVHRAVEEALEAWDLTWGQFNTLLYLVEREEAPGVREAIEEVGGGFPRRLDRLEELGYVRREPHPEDGRKKIIEVTEEGLRAKQEGTLALESLAVGEEARTEQNMSHYANDS